MGPPPRPRAARALLAFLVASLAGLAVGWARAARARVTATCRAPCARMCAWARHGVGAAPPTARRAQTPRAARRGNSRACNGRRCRGQQQQQPGGGVGRRPRARRNPTISLDPPSPSPSPRRPPTPGAPRRGSELHGAVPRPGQQVPRHGPVQRQHQPVLLRAAVVGDAPQPEPVRAMGCALGGGRCGRAARDSRQPRPPVGLSQLSATQLSLAPILRRPPSPQGRL
jgi:hypothetical protein